MRIGIDAMAIQSPGSRGRGVGRFGQNLLRPLLDLGRGHQFVVYAHDGFPDDHIPTAANVVRSRLTPEVSRKERSGEAVGRLVGFNPDGVDAFLVLNPFELGPGYDPPPRPPDGPAVVGLVHDLIPFLFPGDYLADPGHAARSYRRLRTLAHYDALLTNSEATRADCLRVLGVPAGRVVTIGGAADGAFFRPDRGAPGPPALGALERHRVRGPFVFALSGDDPRKNNAGLVEAFGLLPPALRSAHQLVIACGLRDATARALRDLARRAGLPDDALVLAGAVSDDDLRVLYQRCAAFAFPSRYEGLGLPLLEAMHCGAAVVGGANSSQVEVVGDAGLLVDAANPSEIAGGLAAILGDPARARRLGDRGIIRARRFSWERTARRALDVLTRFDPRRSPRTRPGSKPRLAVFGPWPPKASRVAPQAAFLVSHLKAHYTVDLYHEPGYVPEPALRSAEFASHDARLFGRHARVFGDRRVLYLAGASRYHTFLAPTAAAHPGVVGLHDLDPADPGRVFEGFENASAIVVPSPGCLAALPDALAARGVVIPPGASTRRLSPDRAAAVRARFGLPPGCLVFGSFGGGPSDPMDAEAVEAFGAVAREFAGARLVLVGEAPGRSVAVSRAEALGLSGRVRAFGRVTGDDFADLAAVTDVGLCLRRPPAPGLASFSLLELLRHGVPTVALDAGPAADLPGRAVRKVRWPADGVAGLAQALRELAGDPARREATGRAAFAHVASSNGWPGVAAAYATVIERTREARPFAVRVDPPGGPPRPHQAPDPAASPPAHPFPFRE